MRRNGRLITLVLFAMYGTMMFVSKIVMEGLPNIHPLSMFIMTLTVVYGVRALIPIYVYVFLNGLFAGFNIWWYPYLYIWTIQCLLTLLIPRNISDKAAAVVYPIVCALFGITFGALYAPTQALMFGYNLKQLAAWIVAGFHYDVIHMISNFFMGMLVLPLSKVLKKLHASTRIPV